MHPCPSSRGCRQRSVNMSENNKARQPGQHVLEGREAALPRPNEASLPGSSASMCETRGLGTRTKSCGWQAGPRVRWTRRRGWKMVKD